MSLKPTRLALLMSASSLSLSMPAYAQANPLGFAISVDGKAIAGDRAVVDVARRADVALAKADVQVRFDGLEVRPRLDVEAVASGGQVTLQSALNYPAFVSRGEMRIIDRAAVGGARTVQVVNIQPNGQVSIAMPEGRDLYVVHRVYDADGRYDETAPLALGRVDDRGRTEGVEDGADSTERRSIRISGGAVTVSGKDVANGARVMALGETIRPDPSGGFVLQRILPTGSHGVDVKVQGGGQSLDLTREVTIPNAEWFYVATADLTFSATKGDSGSSNATTGRFAGFVNGKTAGGLRITASADTGEGDLKDAFRRLEYRDPRQLLLRVDPEDLYPTYGDDSTSTDLTPTSGRVFLRVEKDNNYIQWGDFDATLGDNSFVRNDRSLYGLTARVESKQTAANGDARYTLLSYAAQPDQVPNRDVFLGTGGSVYFLDKQDITRATETISVQLRDQNTGRVLETKVLKAGQDYAINYIQGVVTLTKPLSSSASSGLFDVGSSSADVVLVAAYEHTPTLADVDGLAYGTRAEGWVADNVRVGFSAMLDETGVSDHKVVGVDLLFRMTEQTYARLDYAKSAGSSFASTYSADGGLIVQNVASTGDSGTALKFEARADLADLGLGTNGSIGGYFEERTEGFNSLDTQVTPNTGDEIFWGVYGDAAITTDLTFSAKIDGYKNDVGERNTTGIIEVSYQASDVLKYGLGLSHEDNTGGTTPGSRTDFAARLSYSASDNARAYFFGQYTIDRDILPENNRLGFGGSVDLASGWSLGGELSDGSLGVAGKITLSYESEDGNTRYVGYEVKPERDLNGLALQGNDMGRIVAGGTQTLSNTVDVYAENSYDMFGKHRSLTSAYGVNYQPTDALTFTGSVEIGRVDDGTLYDFDRQAVTLGFAYRDDKIEAAARIEYRTEDGLLNGVDVTSDTLLISTDAQIKINDDQRFIFAADLARTETDQTSLLNGEYANVVLGFSHRPVKDDKLNILARYRYLSDTSGLRNAQATDGPRQRSNVLSLDVSYDLDRHWTIAGKLGYRMSETAADSTSTFVQNDALLAVAGARYHLVHDWDVLLEARQLNLIDAQTSQASALAAVYKHMGEHVKVGVGYNFGNFSDDLTDLTQDDQGAFINIIAKF